MSRLPELLSLTNLAKLPHGAPRSIVYPDPPLGVEEATLFADVASDVGLFTLTDWLAEERT